MKELIEFLLKIFIHRPVSVQFDTKMVSENKDITLPVDVVSVTFTNLGDPCQVSGWPMATGAILSPQIEWFEKDETKYSVFWDAIAVNRRLMVTFKVIKRREGQ